MSRLAVCGRPYTAGIGTVMTARSQSHSTAEAAMAYQQPVQHSPRDLPGREPSPYKSRVLTIVVLVVIAAAMVASYFWYAG
jgi:hypothetical protein